MSSSSADSFSAWMCVQVCVTLTDDTIYNILHPEGCKQQKGRVSMPSPFPFFPAKSEARAEQRIHVEYLRVLSLLLCV